MPMFLGFIVKNYSIETGFLILTGIITIFAGIAMIFAWKKKDLVDFLEG